jgi:hypothetical protein
MKKLSDVQAEINEGLEKAAKMHGFVNETEGVMAEFAVTVIRHGAKAEIYVKANDEDLYYGAGSVKDISEVYSKILRSASEHILPFAAGTVD